jgi:hypothetical protein
VGIRLRTIWRLLFVQRAVNDLGDLRIYFPFLNGWTRGERRGVISRSYFSREYAKNLTTDAVPIVLGWRAHDPDDQFAGAHLRIHPVKASTTRVQASSTAQTIRSHSGRRGGSKSALKSVTLRSLPYTGVGVHVKGELSAVKAL